jgi:DNA processing protein
VRVIDALSARSARGIPDVAARAGLAVSEVQAVLGALELDGRVRARDAGWVKSS